MQQYLFIPAKYKDCYLAYLLDEFKGQTTIIFVATCNNALRVTVRTGSRYRYGLVGSFWRQYLVW